MVHIKEEKNIDNKKKK